MANRDEQRHGTEGRGEASGKKRETVTRVEGSVDREGEVLHGNDPVREGARRDPDTEIQSGPRRNPPLAEDVASEDGGISTSGGVAAERGHAGSSDRAVPAEEGRSGPAEYKSTSRTDLDHPDHGRDR